MMTAKIHDIEKTQEAEQTLLSVSNLSVCYQPDSTQPVKAVDNVSFNVEAGETVGIVGESGCGKSTLGLALMRLLSDKKVALNGEVLFRGDDVLRMNNKQLQAFRGRRMSMVLQDLTALNPVFSVGDQIIEAIVCHQQDQNGERLNRDALRQRAIAAGRRASCTGAVEAGCRACGGLSALRDGG